MFEWIAERLAMAVLRKMIKVDLTGKRRNVVPNDDFADRKNRIKRKDAELPEARCLSCNRVLYSYEHPDYLCRVCQREGS